MAKPPHNGVIRRHCTWFSGWDNYPQPGGTRPIQGGGDALQRLQGWQRLAVFELTDEPRGHPGMLGEGHSRQPPHLAHMAKLLPQIHGLSLSPLPLSRTRGRRGEGAKKPAIFPLPLSPSLTGRGGSRSLLVMPTEVPGSCPRSAPGSGVPHASRGSCPHTAWLSHRSAPPGWHRHRYRWPDALGRGTPRPQWRGSPPAGCQSWD
jgi:hypothetical protein